jgi:hypothetical protein
VIVSWIYWSKYIIKINFIFYFLKTTTKFKIMYLL